MSDTVRLIYSLQAEKVSQDVIASHTLRAKMQAPKMDLRVFPFDGGDVDRYATEAIEAFKSQCQAYCRDLLQEIQEKAAVLQQNIRAHVAEEWARELARQKSVYFDHMKRELAKRQQEISREESANAVNQVTDLPLQTALACASADAYCEAAIASGTQKLRRAADNLHPRCVFLLADAFENLKSNIGNDVRTKVSPHWKRMKEAAQRWKEAEQDKAAQEKLAEEAERHRLEERRLQAEAAEKIRQQERRAQEERKKAERQRKATRPENLKELLEAQGKKGRDLVGEKVWLYPGGKAGLQYEVTAWSPYESRLSLVKPSDMEIRKVQVTIRWDSIAEINWWTVIEELDDIDFYFDGATMGIVFTTPVKIEAGQAIYIDVPDGTDIENIDWCGSYTHWTNREPPNEVVMNEVGTHTRGPRLQSDHA
jgi:hypothetical protein